MYNTEAMANLCDMRKAIISGLASMGLAPHQIYACLQTPYTNNAYEYMEDATKHYDSISKCMTQLAVLGIAPDDATTQVYYFDWEEGVYEETVSALMMYSNPYAGQQLVVEVKDIIPKILRPLMDEAIEAGDAQCIYRLAQAMVYVLTKLQSQEAGDVD